ncbi:MAG: ABC transporter ATP-binding protein/permease [Bacteroidia bacterium]|nr:ABC transporter ATP-binding protein [Bacteroidia bacterium]MCZ2277175.1 ABC transporter ATP-binding protein/permease [Bacteroidia bacterium]
MKGKVYDVKLLARIGRFAKPHHTVFIASVILTLLMAGLGPLRPWLVQYTIDNPISNNDTGGLIRMTMILLALLVIQTIIQFAQQYYTGLIGLLVIRDLRIALFKKLISFRIRYFDKTPIGNLITRMVSDMETIADIFSEGLIIIIGDLIQILGIVLFMFYMDIRLTLISLTTMPLLIIATNIFKKRIRITFNDVRNAVARLNTFVQEHITGMRVVQIFGREQEEIQKFDQINKSHLRANIRSIWYYSIFFPIVEILAAISIALVIWQGAGDALRGAVGFGTIVAFIMYINMLFRPIRELADKFNTLQMGMVSSERVFKIIDEEEEEIRDGSLIPGQIKGNIEFRNVSFAYDEKNPVLRNISFKVKAGTTAAFVGPTGSGKSTIINLLCRFYDIKEGEILIDGINIKDYNIYELRQRIGLVLQDVFLFSGTVADNITLFNPEISKQQIEEAALQTGALDFILKLPGQFQFNVHERGALLSTGQRQLISFARAYAYQPDLLILDEATSSIDSESEELIINATRLLSQNRTSIIIAHRLSTIHHAGVIFVMDHGQIAESGTHQELLDQKGIYSSLYRSQFKKLNEAI